jgi:hypothetical protein
LRTFSTILSSNLLEAELRAALVREGVDADASRILSVITWIYPQRPLTAELERVLRLGRVRGADLWHLACALFVAPDARELSFITLDPPQKGLARKLGFTV